MPDGDGGRAPLDAVAHVALRVGRGLLADGADAAHTRGAVERVVVAFGYEAHALVEPEAVLVTVQGAQGFRTKVGRALPAMAVDMGRLIRLGAVMDAIAKGNRDLVVLNERLDAVDSATGYPIWLTTVGMAVTAACLARLFGADWPVVAAAFFAGVVGTVLRRTLARPTINAMTATFVTAFVSGLAGALAMRLAPGQSPTLCLVAAGMILVPGVPLINGVRDLVGGHAGTGVARLALSAVTLLAIGFALFLAAAVAGDALPVAGAPGRLPVWEDVPFSAFVAIGYATLFNVPLRALGGCMVCSMAGNGLRTGLEDVGLDLATASLIGAGAAGLVARLLAASWRVSPVVFGFPGVVAMMPGSYAFRAGIGGLQVIGLGATAPLGLVADTLSLTLTTMLVTAAIAIGLSLAFASPSLFTSSTNKKDARHDR